MPVVVAEGPLLDRILDQTYAVWDEGLSRRAYAQWNAAQARLPWARGRLDRLALVGDGGELLATLKRYRHEVVLDGGPVVMCGLGAIFTPEPLRGRGHATRLIEHVLDEERGRGAALAGLFSEIGPAMYARLGFSPVPFDEVTVGVTRQGGSPAMLVRAGDDRDLPAIAQIHATRAEGVRFSLRKTPPSLQFALARRRLFAGLSDPGRRQFEFVVAEEGHTAVAYALISRNAHGWTLEEAGDRDPAAARLGAMLQVLLAREPSERTPLIRAWWPRALPVPPQLALRDRTAPKDLFMVKALSGVLAPAGAADVFFWRSDSF